MLYIYFVLFGVIMDLSMISVGLTASSARPSSQISQMWLRTSEANPCNSMRRLMHRKHSDRLKTYSALAHLSASHQ